MLSVQDLGSASCVVMDAGIFSRRKGNFVAHDGVEPLLSDPPTHEVARHVHDYEKFIGMIKWGAIVCLIVGFAVLLIIS